MAVSEAQKRANAKYFKEKCTQKVVRFYPTEADILAHLEKQPNYSGYIKELIRRDMNR